MEQTGNSRSVNFVAAFNEPVTGFNNADVSLNFTVVFSEQVLGFTSSDISLIGSTAALGGAIVSTTGNGTTFNVSIRNVTSSGQVQAGINAQSVQDRVGNPNVASTSTDNIVMVPIPTFAGVNGRVLRGNYRGIYNVRLVLTAANGQEYYAAINSFGY